ncbi:LOW QUALITY PROTEIN: CXXC motif containing zinc binding protein [Lagenorhynchus albirostris]|uniref:LOW QUALITY PROTEIN: CXXC motif containing zinc binding protein n=1 Tax=Lagenorhynchus albirostris TaxID=27610 RepID=UPI0028EE9193|nr:LOW QUALITY PROTEIN: CXXC motif containing zinc binding protein [Lagenorhynchus albirostris]
MAFSKYLELPIAGGSLRGSEHRLVADSAYLHKTTLPGRESQVCGGSPGALRPAPRPAQSRSEGAHAAPAVYDGPKSSGRSQRRLSRVAMGKIALQLKATMENVTNLRPVGEDFRWYLKMKCGNCGEISEKWQYIRLMDNVALKGGRGSASMVQKCKLCSRENSIEILSSTIKPYNAEDNEKFKTIVEFECRGLEPVDFQPQAGFAAEGLESGTVFSDINLQEKDWTDYDEKAQESVGIYEVTHQFVKS